MMMEREAGVVRMMGWASLYRGGAGRGRQEVDEGGESILLSKSRRCWA
jgi:hypothetical protein